MREASVMQCISALCCAIPEGLVVLWHTLKAPNVNKKVNFVRMRPLCARLVGLGLVNSNEGH